MVRAAGEAPRRPSQLMASATVDALPTPSAAVIAASGLEADPENCVPGAEVILVKRIEIRRREKELRRLRKENNILKARLDEETAKLDGELKARVADARQDDKVEMEELSQRCTILAAAADQKEQESQAVMRAMEHSHAEAADQLQGLYEMKLEHEEEIYMSLEAVRKQLEEQVESVLQDREAQLEQERELFQASLVRLTAEKDLEIKKHKDLLAYTQHQFEQFIGKASTEHDAEVSQVKVNSVKELDQQKRNQDKLSKEQETLLYGLDMMEKERERIEKEQHDASMTINNLKSQVEELSRTVKSLETEKRERESTLQDKEVKIDNYNAKVTTLKKFKHILDKRLNEVTESLQPKDQMIGQLKDHLKELEDEFEAQVAEHRSVQTKIAQKVQQVGLVARSIEELRMAIKERTTIKSRYSMDLRRVVNIEDEARWGPEIRKMFHTYVLGGLRNLVAPLGEDVQHEIRLLDRRMNSLASKAHQMDSSCKNDVQRRANENAVLVAELNGLRIHHKSLEREHRRLQKKLAEVQQSHRHGRSSVTALPPASSDDSPTKSTAPTAEDKKVAAPAQLAMRPQAPREGLPGPRQQHSASHGDLRAPLPSRITAERKPNALLGRLVAVPPLEHSGSAVSRAAARQIQRPLSSGALSLRPVATKQPPAKQPAKNAHLKHLLHSAEVGMQNLQMQKVRNKLLHDQAARLAREEQAEVNSSQAD